MLTHLITLSVLIAVMMLIRALFRRSVSPNIMYALWLVVLIKLCVPFSLFEADIGLGYTKGQAAIDAPKIGHGANLPVIESTYEPQAIQMPDQSVRENIPVQSTPITPEAEENAFSISDHEEYDVKIVVWIGGSVLFAVIFAASACVLMLRLHGDRVLYKTLGRIKVYVSDSVGTPCLVGFLPSIYLTHEAAGSESESTVLLHECTHLRHGDHIWSVLRTLAIIVYWWNPLVWAAAIFSKQDAELACDYSIAKRMSDTARIDYARIIVDMIPKKRGYTVGLGGGSVKDRIVMLTKWSKKRALAAVIAVILTISAVGCSFIGQKEKTEEVTVMIDTDHYSFANEDHVLTLPNEYTEFYLINPEGEEMPEDALFTVYYKPAYERMPDASFGLMFLVYQYTRGELEFLLASDGSGMEPFATDGEYYYILAYPTDVTYDPLKGQNFGEISDACREMIRTSMVSANGWSVYDSESAYSEPTYFGDHVYLHYYPYRAYPGILSIEESETFYYTLMLSQPADKGENGMWCVERWNAENDRYTKLVFPDSGDLSAVDYYAELQRKYVLSGDTYYNNPVNAALVWVKEYFGHDAATLDSFEISGISTFPEFLPKVTPELLERFEQIGVDYRDRFLDREYIDEVYDISYFSSAKNGEELIISQDTLDTWEYEVLKNKEAYSQADIPILYRFIKHFGIEKEYFLALNESRKNSVGKMTLDSNIIEALYIEDDEKRMQALLNPFSMYFDGHIYTWIELNAESEGKKLIESFPKAVAEDYIKKAESQPKEAFASEIKRYPSIESIFEEIDGKYSLMPQENYEYAAYSFVHPDDYRKELGEEKYGRLKAITVSNYNFTYAVDESGVCKIYISINAHGDLFGKIMNGWSTHEVYVGEKGRYVDCYDGEIGSMSEAALELADYMAYTGSYKFPEDGITNMSGLCGYIISKLEAKGEPASADAIREYAEKCFKISDITLPDDLLYDETDGTYTYASDKRFGLPYYIVGDYASPYSPVNLTVWYYTDHSRYFESHMYEYQMRKVDGDWVFTSSTMAVYSPYEPGVYRN